MVGTAQFYSHNYCHPLIPILIIINGISAILNKNDFVRLIVNRLFRYRQLREIRVLWISEQFHYRQSLFCIRKTLD